MTDTAGIAIAFIFVEASRRKNLIRRTASATISAAVTTIKAKDLTDLQKSTMIPAKEAANNEHKIKKNAFLLIPIDYLQTSVSSACWPVSHRVVLMCFFEH